jgi:hypothetical protein
MFDDPREPWLIRGILIALASLFDLCKGIKIEFKGDGAFAAPSHSVPGHNAQSIRNEFAGKSFYVADADLFEQCIGEIRESNVELTQAIKLLKGFNNRVSVTNLVHQLVNTKKPPELSKALDQAGIQDSIGEFTFDFQEIVRLSELLGVAYRNRESHKKLRDGTDRAFIAYHHAIMSRFLQLVEQCSEYSKSRGWWTSAPFCDQDGESVAMVSNHEEAFKSLTDKVFQGMGCPPLQSISGEISISEGARLAMMQSEDPSINDVISSISKADIYEIVDIIRETHHESSSHVLWLEEQLSSLVASAAEDIKISLLQPWMSKDIEAVLDFIATKSVNEAGPTVLGIAPVDGGEAHASRTISKPLGSLVEPMGQVPIPKRNSAAERRQEILYKLRTLRNEIRDKLHQINPRFEFYHCILQSDIVAPAVRMGVCSYEQLKQTDEFEIRILRNNKSFMLDMQEDLYRDRINQLLSENQFL